MSSDPSLFDDLFADLPAAKPTPAPPKPPTALSADAAPDSDAAPFDGAVPVAPEAADDPADGRETLFLADALALAYRAFFSMKNATLTAPDGMDTRTLYGFASSLIKLLEDFSPEHIAVVFDPIGGEPTFRDELYAEYKGHRPPMPDEIKGNLDLIKRLVEAFDIPCVEFDGMEADDVIGTLAKRAEAEDVNVVIFSPDKDFRQLLSSHVSMLRPPYMGNTFDRETPETFREKYGGLEPVQFIDLLALMGDAADNVPGVPGIGEKTAVDLIEKYGTVEKLIEHASELKGKRAREGMTDHAADAILSKKLVTIETAVPLDLDWHTLRRTDPDVAALDALFDEVGFGDRLRKRVHAYAEGRPRRSLSPAADAPTPVVRANGEDLESLDTGGADYQTIYNRSELDAAKAVATNPPHLSFDTETTSVNSMMASLVGLSLAQKEGAAVYIPTPLPDGTMEQDAIASVRAALEDPAILKVGHNVKYDLVVMARHGVRVRGPVFDTMVAHYLIDADAGHKLDDVARTYLQYRMKPISDLIGTGKNAISMRDVPVEDAGPYACEDADIALRLMPVLREKLLAMDDEGRLLQIAEDMEFPLVNVLADMEMAGVKIDEAVLGEISKQLDGEMAELETSIYELAGRTFLIGSTQQLGDVLFNPPGTDEQRAAAEQWTRDSADPKAAGKTKKQLKEEAPTYGIGLEPKGKTATGRPSTDESVLSELALEHDLPAAVLDWRKMSKLKGTYVDKLPELIHPETGRVHTDFNQTVAATGRLSSSNPGLQNIPIRTEMGREIRRAFVAEAGHMLVSADYAQIELRIIAHMSGDEGLRQAFAEGRDIHTATASTVFGVAYDDVTRVQRDRVKQVNYGIPYGISAFGLAQRMRVSRGEAKELIDQYESSYPGVVRFLGELIENARERGFVETMLGRRRYVPDIQSRNPMARSAAERIAVNMPIQGTQADMIKRAMISIHHRLRDEGLKTRMILQVHDELVFEAPSGELETIQPLIRDEMAGALPLDIPVVVDIGVADNWLDAH